VSHMSVLDSPLQGEIIGIESWLSSSPRIDSHFRNSVRLGSFFRMVPLTLILTRQTLHCSPRRENGYSLTLQIHFRAGGERLLGLSVSRLTFTLLCIASPK
jgi:hypothetical protein